MTIQEAIKSCKKFRRPNWYKNNFLVYDPFDQRLILHINGSTISEVEDKLSPPEILAEDWETIEDEHELDARQQTARDIAKKLVEKSIAT